MNMFLSAVDQDKRFRAIAKNMGLTFLEPELDTRQASGELRYHGLWLTGTSEINHGQYFNPINKTDQAVDVMLHYGLSVVNEPDLDGNMRMTVAQNGRRMIAGTFRNTTDQKIYMRRMLVDSAYALITGTKVEGNFV
jgi:hypothetical protein